MKSTVLPFSREPSAAEQRVLQAIREISFGIVEVVIHEKKIAEIRQTKRIRQPQEEEFPTGQPEDTDEIRQNDDYFNRVVRPVEKPKA